MLMNYAECQTRYNTPRRIHTALDNRILFRLERGIYSDCPHVPTLAIIRKKYPDAVLTLESAFYYHGLTDDIPERYALATDSNAAKIRDNRVKQYFVPAQVLQVGVTTMEIERTTAFIYNKERMLIELARNKTKLPFDFYKEVLRRYRDHVNELDIASLQEYIPQELLRSL